MDGTIENQVENLENQTQVDPWEAAFAALNKKPEDNVEAVASAGEPGENGSGDDTGSAGGQRELSDQTDGEDNVGSQGDNGGFDPDLGRAGVEDVEPGEDLFSSLGSQDVEQYRTELNERVRNQAIDEIAKEFVKRGVRNTNGILGATMDDKDVCKRDEDGVPHFFNPETGQEFRGDNPRRQAQEWVDDYNKELARVFNNACAEYEKHLLKDAAPSIAVMEFAPKYRKLDDIRKGMFDDVISDYEVKDSSGKVIGYSCDLDKALALVERQIVRIQNYAKSKQSQQTQQPSGPALDMKTSSGAIASGEQSAPKSLAEAMERLQDAQLAKIKR